MFYAKSWSIWNRRTLFSLLRNWASWRSNCWQACDLMTLLVTSGFAPTRPVLSTSRPARMFGLGPDSLGDLSPAKKEEVYKVITALEAGDEGPYEALVENWCSADLVYLEAKIDEHLEKRNKSA
eukprot:g41774.t1